MDSSNEELPCVGRLEIARPKPAGFLCGTIPVLADTAFSPLPQSALVPSTQTIEAPRYQMLPTETDLNTLPLLPDPPVKVLPDASVSDGDVQWESGPISQNISKKCEALAVYSLTEYGDEIDVVASTDILKQIFKMPYSKSRLSIAVQRIGDTLILNSGPDIEEGEKMFRRQSNQPLGSESSIFLNFAMHSVRAEACDCPPNHYAKSENQPSHSVLPGQYGHSEGTFVSSTGSHSGKAQFLDQSSSIHHGDGLKSCADYTQEKRERVFWGCKKKPNTKAQDSASIASQLGGKSRSSVKESEKYKRIGNNDFLRVLIWQFHNFRMLLGSDLLMFSNEKYIAVSLHLWDISRQVTPLSWLEAWLDNVMAGVPELAVCYHRNGVVQGYELLKTDDIFLLKGISEDGTPAFHPQVVQQNGLSVLRFLQKNCKQDPGAYWLYKNAGDDVIQLFDLCVLPKNTSTDENNVHCDSLSTLMHKGRKDSLFTLGILLYRIAHRLSLSKVSDKKAKCAKFLKKCLDFLHKQDHLVVRAYAHEQFARLILKCHEELDIAPESFLVEYEATVTDVDDESSEFSVGMFGSAAQDRDPPFDGDSMPSVVNVANLQSPSEEPRMLESGPCMPRSITMSRRGTMEVGNPVETRSNACINDSLAINQFPVSPTPVQTITDPVSSRLAAIHHVSQAIKSLRWNRQLQTIKDDPLDHGNGRTQGRHHPDNLSQCACDDTDCIEVCDIREWLTKAKMDSKLWKLVLLLGESYLALGEAYMEDSQLHRALKVIELACSVYGSMPQHLEDAQFISSMGSHSSSQVKFERGSDKYYLFTDTTKENDLSSIDYCIPDGQSSSNYLFWAKVWTLVGDVFVEYHRSKGKHVLVQEERRKSGNELRMSNEVVREVTRLKKKLGRYKKNCSMCSLINCSCQSDRASSGYSASSSGGDAHSMSYSRKVSLRTKKKQSSQSVIHNLEGESIPTKIGNAIGFGSENLQNINGSNEKAHTMSPVHDKTKGSSIAVQTDGSISENEYQVKHGGIFEFLEGPKNDDAEYNLLTATYCYEMARKALGCHVGSLDIHPIIKKKGWVCNEMGRLRLSNGDLRSAELAFVDAIKAFKEVSDHTNIILINCNLGHGRRALAEEVVNKIEKLKFSSAINYSHKQALEKAKLEYMESLKYYKNAKEELIVAGYDGVDLPLQSELYTQYANTYLRLGMLLTRELNSKKLHGSGELELNKNSSTVERADERQICNLSACDAFMEALKMYESLGESRRQEAAFAHFHLGCYYKASCLRFLDSDLKLTKLLKAENGSRQRAKLHASTAERHWKKALDFYRPKTHPSMFLKILLELSALCVTLSKALHLNAVLESALCHLFEGRHTVDEAGEDAPYGLLDTTQEEFWNHLQSLLKKMLSVALSGNSNKAGNASQPLASGKLEDVAKLREIYRMSLKSSNLNQLHAMYKLWIS